MIEGENDENLNKTIEELHKEKFKEIIKYKKFEFRSFRSQNNVNLQIQIIKHILEKYINIFKFKLLIFQLFQ